MSLCVSLSVFLFPLPSVSISLLLFFSQLYTFTVWRHVYVKACALQVEWNSQTCIFFVSESVKPQSFPLFALHARLMTLGLHKASTSMSPLYDFHESIFTVVHTFIFLSNNLDITCQPYSRETFFCKLQLVMNFVQLDAMSHKLNKIPSFIKNE